MKKRALSLFLVFVLCLGLLPAAAFAGDGDGAGGSAVQGQEQAPEQDTAQTDGGEPAEPEADAAPQSDEDGENGDAAVTEGCEHNSVNKDTGICNTCGAQMVAEVDGTYFTDIVDAINHSNSNSGSYATLLTDVSINQNVTIANAAGEKRSFCLDLAGHTLACSGDFSIGSDSDKDAVLEVKGSGSIDADICVMTNGCLNLIDWLDGTIKSVTLDGFGAFHCSYRDVTTESSKGEIKELQYNDRDNTIRLEYGLCKNIYNNTADNIVLEKLLVYGCAFRDEYGNLLKRTETIAGQGHIQNVTVVECTTHVDEDSNGRCDYCNTLVSASVTTKSGKTTCYETLTDAFAATGFYDTITLLDDVTLTETLNISVGDNYENYFTLDLNGKKISSNFNSNALFVSATLTICDSSAEKTGSITNDNGDGSAIRAGQGGRLKITDGTFGTVSVCDNAEFSGGTFSKIWSFDRVGTYAEPLASTLKDGYAFEDSNGNLVNGYEATNATNVKVVPHEKHSFDENGVCACGVSCAHTEMDENGNCRDCGKFLAIASVTVDGTTTYYTDLQKAIDSASNGTVTLLDTVKLSEGVTLNNEKSDHVTLDLNGFILSGNSEKPLITVSQNMTICDSKDGTDKLDWGCISNSHKDSDTIRLTGGHLTFQKCRIQESDGRALYAVAGSLTVEAGWFPHEVFIGSDCPVTINNGKFDKAVSIASPNAKISGGEFQSTVSISGAGTEISGGSFPSYNGIQLKNVKSISGGTFSFVTIEGSSKVISGGSFDGELKNLSGTVEDLLADGYAFKHSDSDNTDWLTESERASGNVFCVDAEEAPIQSVSLTATTTTVTYGNVSPVQVSSTFTVVGDGEFTQTWYVNGKLYTRSTYHMFSYDLPSDSSAGKYVIRVVFTKNGYSVTKELTITVKPADITGADVIVDDLTYNGTAQTPTVTVKIGDKTLTAGTDYDVTVTAQKDAGSYKLTVTGKGNYDGIVENVEWKIAPKTLANLTISVAPCTYNGSAQEPPVELKDGDTAIPESEYTLEYSNNTNAGTATVTVKAKDGGNYKFDPQEEKFTIAKAEAPEMQPAELAVINGVAKTYLFDLPALPALPDPCAYGSVRYEAASFALTGGYENSTATITTENKFQLTVPQVDSEEERSVGTVTVKITTENYQDITLTCNFTAKNKITPVVDGVVSASAITYGQALSESTITGKMKDPDTGAEVEGTFAWTDGTTKPKADNGEYRSTTAEWVFTPAGENAYQYEETTGEVRVVVNKAEFTNVSVEQDGTLTYNGQPQTARLKQTVTAVDNGETIKFGYSAGPWKVGLGYYSTVPAFTEAGKHTVYYDVYDWDSNHKTVEGQFTVTIEPKTVTDPTILVEDAVYTGEELKPAVTVKDGETVIPESEYTVSYADNTNAGTATVTITDKEGGNYVVSGSTAFEIAKAAVPETAPGTLTVYNRSAQAYEVDLKTLLPELTAPCAYGEISYSGILVELADGYYDSETGASVTEDGILKLPVLNVSSSTAAKIGTVKVTVSTRNYGDFTLLIDVSAANKSSGGGSSGSTATKTETTTNPDGSTTKTETRADGTVTETTTGKDGSTTKTVTKADGSSVTERKTADGSTGTVKTDADGKTEAEAKISTKAVEDAKKADEAVKVPTEVKAGEDPNSAPTVKVELPKNAGETKIEIPVENVSGGTVAVLVHEDGTEEIVKDSVPTEDGIQLTVDGSATVKIIDNSKDFSDTKDHWAKDAIDFVSARGLVSGVSSTAYAPNASTTRAQLWTILARQNDADLTGGANWYEKAQTWSKANGISDGTDPNGIITRAQMVTMLWRAAGSPAAQSAGGFDDVAADSYYAQAVAWAAERGITTGTGNGAFSPEDTCTRAQIAVFLMRGYQSK